MPNALSPTLIAELNKVAALVSVGESMTRHTTFRIGGPADVFAVAETTDQLVHIVNVCRQHNAPIFVLGAGSNILVSDLGIRGVVIRNKSADFSLDGDLVSVDSGYPMPKFVNDISKFGLSGCEFLQSIPGTMGGGARQNVRFRNARHFDQYEGLQETRQADSYLGEFIVDLEVLSEHGERKLLPNEECGFTYTGIHASGLAGESLIITRLHLQLQRDSVAVIQERLQQYRAWRSRRTTVWADRALAQPEDEFTGTRPRQPVGATAGCVFFNVPNPYNHPTGRLIDLCGLKGRRIGGAEISPAHANYIVNRGGAKAEDVRALMDLAKEAVYERFGVRLAEEVELVGQWQLICVNSAS